MQYEETLTNANPFLLKSLTRQSLSTFWKIPEMFNIVAKFVISTKNASQ